MTGAALRAEVSTAPEGLFDLGGSSPGWERRAQIAMGEQALGRQPIVVAGPRQDSGHGKSCTVWASSIAPVRRPCQGSTNVAVERRAAAVTKCPSVHWPEQPRRSIRRVLQRAGPGGLQKYVTMFGAEMSIREFYDVFYRRGLDAKIKIPKAVEASFANPQTDDERAIKALIDEHNDKQAAKFEEELSSRGSAWPMPSGHCSPSRRRRRRRTSALPRTRSGS